MTPAEKKEIAAMLRDHARQLEEKGRPIFHEQIVRLLRQADRLDPHMAKVPLRPCGDTAIEVKGPCVHGV